MANKLVRSFTVVPATATYRLGYDPTAYPHAECRKNLTGQWKKFLDVPPTPRQERARQAARVKAPTARGLLESVNQRRQAKLEAMLLKEQKKDDATALMLLREIEALEEMKVRAEEKYSTLDRSLRPKTASFASHSTPASTDRIRHQAHKTPRAPPGRAPSQPPTRCSTAYSQAPKDPLVQETLGYKPQWFKKLDFVPPYTPVVPLLSPGGGHVTAVDPSPTARHRKIMKHADENAIHPEEAGSGPPFLNNLWMEDPYFCSGNWSPMAKGLATFAGRKDQSYHHGINPGHTVPQGIASQQRRLIKQEIAKANGRPLRAETPPIPFCS